MEFDEESAIYGVIDRHCRVLESFQAKSWEEIDNILAELRK